MGGFTLIFKLKVRDISIFLYGYRLKAEHSTLDIAQVRK